LSIVELMVAHEAEYLEHCRRYALDRRSDTQHSNQ
jgi:hypothetical protein